MLNYLIYLGTSGCCTITQTMVYKKRRPQYSGDNLNKVVYRSFKIYLKKIWLKISKLTLLN